MMLIWWINSFYQNFKFELWLLNIVDTATCIAIIKNPTHEKHKLIQNIIITSPKYSYFYARFILTGPWPLGEKIIATNAKYSYYYAVFILHDRFPLGEPSIKNDPTYKPLYKMQIKVAL